MIYKKIFYVFLVLILIFFIALQKKVNLHNNGSSFCYLDKKADYIKEDGINKAYQNDYLVIESKGIRNYIIPYSHTTYILNSEGKFTCEDIK